MARFDDLPVKILVDIFSYLSKPEHIHSIRNVCTWWRKVSKYYELLAGGIFWANGKSTGKDIIYILKRFPALTQFVFFGPHNVLRVLSEYCTNIRKLWVPNVHISADVLQLIMERLPALKDLRVSVTPTPEGLEMTRMIGKSETLINLELLSSGQEGAMEGLLMPIADGCPNLSNLRCANFNCSDSELCYLMQRKRRQLLVYYNNGVVSASSIQALNECPNLKRVVFTRAKYHTFPQIPHITWLQNLEMLEVLECNYEMLHLIHLTLFQNTLSHLSYIRICHIFGDVDLLINEILLKCPLLTHLELEENQKLTCKALRNISSCKILKYLNVSHCKNVDKDAIQYVAKGCPQMQHLDVSGIPLSDDLFREILRCRMLKTLVMTFTDVSVIDLDLISTNIPGLKYLIVGPMFKFGHDCTRDIKQHMPHLVIQTWKLETDMEHYYLCNDMFVNIYIKNRSS